MTPEQLAQVQRQAANMSPDMMQQAMNMAQNMSPEEMQRAQQVASNLPPEQVAQQAGNFEAGMSAMSAQQKYQYDGSMQLKNEGNTLHGQRRFQEAAEKYERALSNLQGHTSRQALDLRVSCQGNLASCFLQLGQWQKCIEQCNAVLAHDSNNRKAYYRRGQAYSEVGDGAAAVRDLEKALALSPESEKGAIKEKLEEAQQKQRHKSRGVVIEEVMDPAPSHEPPQEPPAGSSSVPGPMPHYQHGASLTVVEADGHVEDVPAVPLAAPAAASQPGSSSDSRAGSGGLGGPAFSVPGMVPPGVDPQQMAQVAQMMKSNPSMVHMAAERMRGMSPEQLQEALRQTGGGAGVTPEMARVAAESLKNMSPEQISAMADQALAASDGSSGASSGSAAAAFRGLTPEMLAAAQSSNPQQQMQAATEAIKKDPSLLKNMARMMETLPPEQLEAMAASMPGAPPGMKLDAEQVRMAAKMMESMSPTDLERMAEMARSMGGGGSTAAGPSAATTASAGAAGSSGAGSLTAADGAAAAPAAAAAAGGLPGGLAAGFDPGSMDPRMMSEMRRKMEDPAMMKMVQNMMKSMDPEALASMMSQSGMKVTPEQAVKMRDSLGNMSEQHIQMLARLTGYLNRAIDLYQSAKALVLSQGLLVLSLAMLLLAVLLRWLGWL
ncbi:hypothetical protein N2152v2_008962 [Parachlorella kessleri]